MNAHIGHMIAACLAKFDLLSDEDQMIALRMAQIASDPKADAEDRDGAATTLVEVFDEQPQQIREWKFDGDDQ